MKQNSRRQHRAPEGSLDSPRRCRSRRIRTLVSAPSRALGLVLTLAFCPTAAQAASSTDELIQNALAAEAEGNPREAIELLKPACLAQPDEPELAIALARAYRADRNMAFAVRVLDRFLDDHPNQCGPRLFLALLHIEQGLLDMAHELLEAEPCSGPPELLARRHLLSAYLAQVESKPDQAKEHLKQARRSPELYKEDRALLTELSDTLEPGRLPLLTGRLDLANGWTSNGLAGSPVDPAANRREGSALSNLDAQLRLTTPAEGGLRLVADGQLRIQQLWASRVEDLSYRSGIGRVGMLLGRSTPQALFALSRDATQIAGNDRFEQGPLWFSEATRAELELTPASYFFFLGGAGYRQFRELARSRREADAAIGWAIPGRWGVQLGNAISLRVHDANHQAYDLMGATLASQLTVPLPWRLQAVALFSVAFDSYPRSEGYFTNRTDRPRRDDLLRLGSELWAPLVEKLKLGLTYEYSARESTILDYDYQAHRVQLRLRWSFDSDTLMTRTVDATGRAPLSYPSTGNGGSREMSEVRELVRQDESARRGSSCQR